MKYLITGRWKAPVPPEQAPELWQAAKDWMSSRLENATLDCHYPFPDVSGGMVIANYDSHEAVWEDIISFPLSPYLAWEIEALCEWEYVYDKTIEAVQG
jgi:hypothetical protein